MAMTWWELTVTWSIQTMSLLSIVMASPPHTYLGLISVMAMFLMSLVTGLFVFEPVDVLDDDVAGTADNPQTLALDHAAGALADDGLVGGDGDTQGTSIVTSHLLVTLAFKKEIDKCAY